MLIRCQVNAVPMRCSWESALLRFRWGHAMEATDSSSTEEFGTFHQVHSQTYSMRVKSRLTCSRKGENMRWYVAAKRLHRLGWGIEWWQGQLNHSSLPALFACGILR